MVRSVDLRFTAITFCLLSVSFYQTPLFFYTAAATLHFSNNKSSLSPVAGSVFGPKDPPPNAVGGLSNSNHHDAWNRLHGGPSGFPAAHSWVKAAEKRDERDRGKDGERREILHIKDEKDRYLCI